MKKEEFEKDDINNYTKTSFFAKIPSWIKILLLKYWAAGAAFYFFTMAAGWIWYSDDSGTTSMIYIFLMLTLGYALISEYIVKQVVRLMRTSRDDTFYYNMINFKGTLSFFANLGYAILIVYPLMFFFSWLGSMGLNMTFWGVEGVEPFSYALAAVILDFIYLFIKNTIVNYIKKRKFAKTNEAKNKEL